MELVLRAWLPNKKKMLHHDEISLTEGRVFERIYYEDTGFMNSFARDDATLMVYTGIRDSKGSPVYEGDIVVGKRSSHWHEGYDKVNARVYYSQQILGFCVDGMGGGALHNIEDLEVIGNVYENEDLL